MKCSRPACKLGVIGASLAVLGACAGTVPFWPSKDIDTDDLSLDMEVDRDDEGQDAFVARLRRTDLEQDCSGFISFCDSTRVRLTSGDRVVVSQGRREQQLYRRGEAIEYVGRFDWRFDDADPLRVELRRDGTPKGGETSVQPPTVADFSVDEAGASITADGELTLRWTTVDEGSGGFEFEPAFATVECRDGAGVALSIPTYTDASVSVIEQGESTITVAPRDRPPVLDAGACDFDVALGIRARYSRDDTPFASFSIGSRVQGTGSDTVRVTDSRRVTVLYGS